MSGDDRHIGQRAIDEESLNSAIDAVAREMTASEPSGALRARILDRIEQGGRRSRPALPRWAWAGAAAGVALFVAAAVWVVSPLRNQNAAQSTIAEQVSGALPPAAASLERLTVQSDAVSPQSALPKSMPAAAGRVRPAAVRGVQAAEIGSEQDFHTVPALPEIEPLRLAAVEPAPLHVADMEITQISEMPSIEIRSLDQGSHDIQSADPKKEK